jgi:hypothetical protein
MSEPNPTSTSIPTPTPSVNQQVLDLLTSFMDQQRAINAEVQAKQEQIFSYIESSTSADTVTAAAEEVEEEKEREQQRQIVRNSRSSIYLGGSSQLLSPIAPPPVRPRTQEEQERRASHGIPLPLATPLPASKTGSGGHATVTSTPGGQVIDKSRNSPYGQCNAALSHAHTRSTESVY